MKNIKAESKWVRSSPRKISRILDLVRGKPVIEAAAILKFLPQKAARIALKVLQSAVANAKHNQKKNEAALVIKECYANKGVTLKRIRPRARGRAFPIKKRTSHVTICVEEK
jgi:large subunit ribosomal protein L22